MSKPFGVGAYAYQRLNLMTKGKAHGRNSQGFKPDLGNSAVRHYRGASENVAMVEMRSQLAIERAGLVTPHLQPARRSSIPTSDRDRECKWPMAIKKLTWGAHPLSTITEQEEPDTKGDNCERPEAR